MKGAEQSDAGWSHLSAVSFNAPKPPQILLRKSGAFGNKDGSPGSTAGKLSSVPAGSDRAEKLPRGKIFRPYPWPKWEALPSPGCPGAGCADNVPQLPRADRRPAQWEQKRG